MKKVILGALLFCSPLIASEQIIENSLFITIDKDALSAAQKSVNQFEIIEVKGDIAIAKINAGDVEQTSSMMHEQFNRCGGFIVHDNYEEANRFLKNDSERSFAKNAKFTDYSLTAASNVTKSISSVSDIRIEQDIIHLSSYKTRHYKSKTGLESQTWLLNKWKSLSAHRSDVDVKFFEHKDWLQPSVMLVLKGASEEAIVVGGHGDSIASWLSRTAPGADDNASGIATMTEMIHVLMETNFKPEKTIYFISYAAEEVGLLGSKEIAKDFKTKGVDVIGVLQLDMTNFKGSDEYDIVMMTDYTNEAQNTFIGTLIDEYLPTLKWGYDRCGYGCSDHASWHGEGFPASVPFEAKKRDMNGHIHTSRDVIGKSDGNATHAAKFAGLGLAYVIELDR